MDMQHTPDAKRASSEAEPRRRIASRPSPVVASVASPDAAPAAPAATDMTPADAARIAIRIIDELDAALACPRNVVELAVATFIAGGHLLLEDVPGVGKTTLARAIGRAFDLDVSRIQCTPDVTPADLTGVNVWSQAEERFVLHRGPLFADIVIADEINRTTPKTQSAMLEAMSEGRISIDGVTHTLPHAYFVIATQNPIELEGTYALPEAQLDRFTARAAFGYPDAHTETAMLTAKDWAHPLDRIHRVCTRDEAMTLRRTVRNVTLAEPVAAYLVAITTATRERRGIRYGASPRASLQLAALARATALMDGRGWVTPDDVRANAVAALAHRLVLTDWGMTGVGMTGVGMSGDGGESGTDFGMDGFGVLGVLSDGGRYEAARVVIEDILRTTPAPRA